MNIDTETPLIELETETEGIYGNLTGKPSINGTVINGNKSGTDYGLAEKSYIDSRDEANLVLAKDYTDLSVAGLATENYADQADATTLLNAKAYTDALLTDKQDKLVAGANINISGRVISATGGGGGETLELIAQGSADTVSSFSISQDTDGNAFNLKEFYLKFENFIHPGVTTDSHKSGSMFLHDTKNQNRLASISFEYNADTAKNRTYSFYLKKVSGYWVALNMSTVYDTGAKYTDYGACTPLITDCDSINFAFFSGSYSFDYELYGVRV